MSCAGQSASQAFFAERVWFHVARNVREPDRCAAVSGRQSGVVGLRGEEEEVMESLLGCGGDGADPHHGTDRADWGAFG